MLPLIAGFVPTTSLALPPMVTVGNPGNAAAPDGRGSVAYEYQIGKYEVSNADSVEFLNAVDLDGAAGDQIYLYSPFYWNPLIGYQRDGAPAQGDKYYELSGMGDKAAMDIGYLPALRFVNWLHNGALRYTTSTTGRTACSTVHTRPNGMPFRKPAPPESKRTVIDANVR
ncbi:MAG: hypothetical protein Fur0032_05920 [Terrimicrobiaceae bacterium]